MNPLNIASLVLALCLGVSAGSPALVPTMTMDLAPDTTDEAMDVIPLNPCEQEDGPGPCFWDASTAGNGVGHSFWIGCDQAFHYFEPAMDAKFGGPGDAYDNNC